MIRLSSICLFIVLISLTSCDRFEHRYYNEIKEGQINAIKNGADTFDLSAITDFEWDSVLLIRGNESVPIFSDEIEEILNNRNIEQLWKNMKTNKINDSNYVYKTTDLPTYKDRFYFLTPEKNMIEKEIRGGVYHSPAVHYWDCLIDSIYVRNWIARKECIFIVETNVRTVGKGTVFLYPDCKTKFSPDSMKFRD